jgi:hypothetical protein
MNIGFSTGSLAYGDFESAVDMLKDTRTTAIELSALREDELDRLLNALDDLDLHQYDYISFHAPSKLKDFSERDLVKRLKKVADRNFSIVLHPDVIKDFNLWRSLGSALCIENMDKRKPIGRTAEDLDIIFSRLPEASFCFDIAHAKQVDSTMSEALLMLKRFGSRLRQLHVSDVNSNSVHESLNVEAIVSFRKISGFIDYHVPIILETPVAKDKIERELFLTALIFDDEIFEKFINGFKLDIFPYYEYKIGAANARFKR